MTDVEPYESLERQVEQAERRAAAVRMRNCGFPLAKIAQAQGYADVRECANDLTEYLNEILRVPTSEYVARQLALVMDMTRAAYQNAVEGDVGSIKAIRELADHQAKLLGLHAPTRHKVSADDNQFSVNAATLLTELGVTMDVELPPTIDAEEPWA